MEAEILSPEALMAQLKTRGFEDGFQSIPLRDFRGRLDSITGEMRAVGTDQKKRLFVSYNFSELDIILSTEPYQLPVAQISIGHSNRKQSGMGVLGASIDRIINADLPADAPITDVKGQDFLIGKIQRWTMTPGHMMWDGKTKGEVAREMWEVTEVEGVGADEPVTVKPAVVKAATKTVKAAPGKGNAIDTALQLLDGKTEQQWQQVVFLNPVVKADKSGLINSIIKKEFIPAMVETERIGKDDAGVYHLL